MRRSPPLAPGASQYDTTVHIELDDFGKLGHAYRETDEAEADGRTIIAFTRAMRDATGNLPPLPGVFPDYMAPVARNAPDAFVSLSMDRLTDCDGGPRKAPRARGPQADAI